MTQEKYQDQLLKQEQINQLNNRRIMNIYTTFKVIKVTATHTKDGGLRTKLHLPASSPDSGPRIIGYDYKYRNHLENALAYLEERTHLEGFTIVGTADNNLIIVV